MRGPELIAQTESPASHKTFIAVPPPAPVPTTITSNIFVGMDSSLFTLHRLRSRSWALLAHANEYVPDSLDAGIQASTAKSRASRDTLGFLVQSSSCNSPLPCNHASTRRIFFRSPWSV